MLYRIALPAVFVVVIVVLLATLSDGAGSNNAGQEMKNLETEIIRIELADRNFDIPLRYMYGKAKEKYHQWPKAKSERVKVDALSLSVLLPNFRPYYPEDEEQWKVKGHGDRLEVTIMKFRGPPENWQNGIELNKEAVARNAQFYQRSDDVFGLSHYIAQGNLNDKYFAQRLQITCDPASPPSGWSGDYSPSCFVKSKYIPNVDLEYYYSRKYLRDWKEIDQGLKGLFDKFYQKNADAENSMSFFSGYPWGIERFAEGSTEGAFM